MRSRDALKACDDRKMPRSRANPEFIRTKRVLSPCVLAEKMTNGALSKAFMGLEERISGIVVTTAAQSLTR